MLTKRVIQGRSELVGTSAHVFPQFEIVRGKFGQRIKALQYRYEGVGNRKFGGVTVLVAGKDIQRTAIFGNR